jgi:DNA mismatch repair protein MutL
VIDMPIRQLAADVAAKIAAGEVVERPASVVKELIENSIDAGATQIRVDLVHGGLQLIRVTDNGSGIAFDELPLALARHATSKVAKIDDLEHIRSLGFRGEALASIAAVAEVMLVSRPRSAEQGAQVSAQGGEISEVTTAAATVGTTITVRNLFSAVPARLKFLKSRNTEVSHCHHLLEQYALAYPEIRFHVYSEGRQIFATPGDGQLSSVLVEVYGLQIAEQMIPIPSSERQDDAEYPIVTGYASRPTCYKSTRQHISFFVNRRWVLSRMLTAAVEGAYHSLLLTGRHPVAVINVELDPSLLDVNVHPAKTEIRFLKERRVFAAILRAVRAALLTEPEMPQWQPKHGSTANSSTTKNPVPDAQDDPLAELESLEESSYDDESSETPAASSSNQIGAKQVFPGDNPWMTVTEEETGTKPPLMGRLWQSHVRGTERDSKGDGEPAKKKSLSSSGEPADRQEGLRRDTQEFQRLQLESESFSGHSSTFLETMTTHAPSSPSIEQTEKRESQKDQPVAPQSERNQPSQASLMSLVQAEFVLNSIDPQQTRRLPRLRVVGQVAQSYIVTEGEDGMFLIDQHAAHERILLERMVASLKNRAPISQLLLTPIKLELAPRELEAIEEYQPQLEHIGFAFDPSDDGMLAIRAVPGILVKQMNSRSLHELLLDITSAESLGDTETWEERALANVACKAAIKANYFLTVSEMREMLEQLEQTQAPYSCCHGRPTMVHFGLTALASAFERR